MLRLRLALPLVRRRLLDLRVRLGACACSTLLAQDDTAGGRNHGIVYANGIFSREHQAKLLATSGPYQGLGLALVKTDAQTYGATAKPSAAPLGARRALMSKKQIPLRFSSCNLIFLML